MSRYRGPRIRIFKRLGYFPGFGFNKKFQKFRFFDKKKKKKEKKSFTIRLKEKQKLRYNYGLTEKNLVKYVQKARKKKNLPFEQILFNSLEMRLDNIVFRLGFAPTLPAARQLITHGHIFLNGQKRNIPSSPCQPNDLITLNPALPPSLQKKKHPSFLFLDKKNLIGKILRLPSSHDLLDLDIRSRLVIEYYSDRKGRNG